MSAAQEGVNIEHLLMNIPLPEDPLPSAEEIAGAKAAAAAAHSTCSAAAVPSQSVKGLGGAGLNLKRKGGKAGNSSTISAATAPPALLGRPAGGAVSNRTAGASNLARKAAVADAVKSTVAAVAAAGTETDGQAGTVAEEGGSSDRQQGSLTGVTTPDGGRSLGRDAAGVRSFRTVLTPGSDEGEGSDWETDSQEVRELGRLEGGRSRDVSIQRAQ
jgi:hypothetical protein